MKYVIVIALVLVIVVTITTCMVVIMRNPLSGRDLNVGIEDEHGKQVGKITIGDIQTCGMTWSSGSIDRRYKGHCHVSMYGSEELANRFGKDITLNCELVSDGLAANLLAIEINPKSGTGLLLSWRRERMTGDWILTSVTRNPTTTFQASGKLAPPTKP